MRAAVVAAVMALILLAQVVQAVVGQAAQMLLATQGLQTLEAEAEVPAATILLTLVALEAQASLSCQSLLVTTQALPQAHPRSLQAAQTPL
jgi:hypothetical protein